MEQAKKKRNLKVINREEHQIEKAICDAADCYRTDHSGSILSLSLIFCRRAGNGDVYQLEHHVNVVSGTSGPDCLGQ